jgi:hypothetical protein
MISSIAISSLRRAATVIPTARSVVAQKRHLSVACAQSVHKLNDVLEEYRAEK